MRCSVKIAALLLLLALKSANATVLLMYHHVAENTPPSTSVTPVQFQQHMRYLAENGFDVIPLEQVIETLRSDKTLPPNSIAITFDDGYQNVADNAHPILKSYDFPYTVFINIEPVGHKGWMDWPTMTAMSKEGATFANHGYYHQHLIRKQPNENQIQWRNRIKQEVLKTEAELAQQLDQSLKALAYPYGEYNTELQQLVDEIGFVGFGQHSGAVGRYTDLTAIPRFPVASQYADIETLKVKLTSLNMPIVRLEGANPELIGRPQPKLTVTLETEDVRTDALMCFVQGQGATPPLWLDKQRFQIQAKAPLPPGRSRYNCTAPSKSQNRFYWFSQPWVQPNKDGSWPEE